MEVPVEGLLDVGYIFRLSYASDGYLFSQMSFHDDDADDWVKILTRRCPCLMLAGRLMMQLRV